MALPSKAVFLSYASQDAEAARRICEGLRAAGIEVWFDQSELRGGDLWDRQIRKQIRECALLIPIISANTQSRSEGHFRLEWKLAVERTHLMSERLAFLLPVTVDATADADGDVPDKFREVHWMRLPGGETSRAFIDRVEHLLAPEVSIAGGQRSGPQMTRELPARPRPAWTKMLFVLIPLAAIGIGYGLLHRTASPAPQADTLAPRIPVTQAGASAPSVIPEKSVAVLPFADMSEKKDQEYFSDGLSDELIAMLSKVPDLRVPARTSAFYFKGKNEPIEGIAQQLRVANVLEGSVRKTAGRLRITAELVRADNGYQLWSDTYDRQDKDIFKVQDEIATAVVQALKVKLASVQQVTLTRSSNTEAYNQYLIGRQFRYHENADGFGRAIDAYHRAVALDPTYGVAYAELAFSEQYLWGRTGSQALLTQAEADAEKAIALAPEDATGYAVRGRIRFTAHLDWVGAQADLSKAQSIEPASTTVQLNYALLFEYLGRLPEAIALEKKAIESDPLSNVAWQFLGESLVCARDYAAAGKAYGRALEIQPNSEFALEGLATLRLLQGNSAEALQAANRFEDQFYKLFVIALAEYSLGHIDKAQQALNALTAKYAMQGAYQIAEVFAWRGDKGNAFEWLARAYQQHDPGLALLKVDPLQDRIRGDARYQAMLRKVNLQE